MAGLNVLIGFSVYNGFEGPPGRPLGMYTLRPETFDISITRNPAIVALPAQNGSNRGQSNHGTGIPRNIAIDFGMMQESITISGKIPDQDMSDVKGNLTWFISKMRTHWVNLPSVFNINTSTNNTGLIKVRVIQEVEDGVVDMTWGCAVLRAGFTKPAGKEYWEYRLVFGVITYPEATSPDP